MRTMLLFLCAAAFVIAGCNAQKRPATGEVPPPEARDAERPVLDDDDAPDPENVVSGVGTVRYVDLEGGFYGLVVGDSARYNPQNLAPEFQEDGLRVRFRAAVQEGMMTTQMWGRPVEILDILRVE